VVEERVIPQCAADFHTTHLGKRVIEQQRVGIHSARKIERAATTRDPENGEAVQLEHTLD
jgi:hypothetical protein